MFVTLFKSFIIRKMQKIIYYVAASIDGHIEGPDHSINFFRNEKSVVDLYLNELKNFGTTIMGRNTYEFGYQFGLEPGELAYPQMEHYIFSRTLKLTKKDPRIHIVDYDLSFVRTLKRTAGTDIYLCGGGIFAGWLLDNEMIDILKVKLNPVIIGSGTPMFGPSRKSVFLTLTESLDCENGFKVLTYRLNYENSE